MEGLLKDLRPEQLEEVRVKFPKYAEKVAEELARREAQEAEMQAKLLEAIEEEEAREKANVELVEVISKVFPTKPSNYTNLLITWEEQEVIDGEAETIEVVEELGKEAKEVERLPKHKELVLVVLENVVWSRTKEGLPKSKESKAKGSRELTVTKIVKGEVKERWGFEDGEKACEYFGIPKDKGSSVARLNNYRDNEGVRYMADYGIEVGTPRK